MQEEASMPATTDEAIPRSGAARLSFSPRIRKSPFFEATRRAGAAEFSVYNKMYLPMGYGDPEGEFRSLIDDVALWDVAVQRIVEIAGPDALAFMDLLTPRDLSSVGVGQCRYVLIIDQNGGILNDPVLLRLAEDRFWLSRADGDVLLWAKGVAVHAGMEVAINEPDVSALQVQGPKSAPVIAALAGQAARSLAYYTFVETDIGGIPVVISRTGWSAERGYEIFLRDGRRGTQLWDAVMAAGKPHHIAPGAPSRIRRVEAGILDCGTDMDETVNPFELGFERLVDKKPGIDYIGRAALERAEKLGLHRRLAGVELAGERLADNQYPWPALADGEAAGRVTSCVYSPRLEKNIGLAMLSLPHPEPGTELTVETAVGRRPARVVKKPFVAARSRD